MAADADVIIIPLLGLAMRRWGAAEPATILIMELLEMIVETVVIMSCRAEWLRLALGERPVAAGDRLVSFFEQVEDIGQSAFWHIELLRAGARACLELVDYWQWDLLCDHGSVQFWSHLRTK